MSMTVVVDGNTTRDLEKKSDKAPYRFGIAVNNAVKQTDGTYGPKFINCIVWEPKADGTGGSPAYDLIKRLQGKGKTLTKGSGVKLTGTMTYDQVEENGVVTTRETLTVTDITYTASAKTSTTSEASATGASQGSLELSDDSSEGEELPLL